MDSKLIPLTKPEGFGQAGIPFKSTHAARWAFRQRRENGLEGAFVRIGKNVFIDVPKFHELVRKQAA